MNTNVAFNDNDLEPTVLKIPKNDLHVHLDGSIRPETLIEISKMRILIYRAIRWKG